ncbi:MAG: hypothetical protein M1816_002040 [Peltula sp. TS41687]|nr:MAG: hypothetical protein M1816_002040 [Peltula sp. TS41687]
MLSPKDLHGMEIDHRVHVPWPVSLDNPYICSNHPADQLRSHNPSPHPSNGAHRLFSTTASFLSASTDSPSNKLPHLTPSGDAHMVSITHKATTHRLAIATGTVLFSNDTPLTQITQQSLQKGDVLAISRIAGIMAAKRTSDLIPLCHPIPLTSVTVDLELLQPEEEEKEEEEDKRYGGIKITSKVECDAKTGVEMEALTAVMGAALSVVDMVKGVDRAVRIEMVKCVYKRGGRSGEWKAEGWGDDDEGEDEAKDDSSSSLSDALAAGLLMQVSYPPLYSLAFSIPQYLICDRFPPEITSFMARRLLENNEGKLIDNPLLHRNYDELESDVRDFHIRHELRGTVDVEVLIRGARVARDPRNNTSGETVPGMTAVEAAALKREKESGFLQQTKELKVTILTTAFAAIVQGWQQSSINASALDWAKAFGLDVDLNQPNRNSHDILLFGFINAAPPLFGSLLGAWLSDPLQAHVYGRRPALFIAALFSFAAVIGSAYTTNWQELLVCRVLLGLGMGAKASIAPVFAAEAAVDHIRGSLILSWQLFDAFGIFLGFATNLAVFGHWRIVLASPLVATVPLLILVFICPESPRFLIRKSKRYPKAYESLRHLRETPLQACRDLYGIHSQLQIETEILQRRRLQVEGRLQIEGQWYSQDLYQKQVQSSKWWQRVLRLFTVARNRRAALAAFIVMISQQLCGFNIVAFYSSSLFRDASSSTKKAAYLSFGVGLANFLFTFPAYGTIDTRGRRFLLLLSLFGMTWTLLAVGFSFQVSEERQSLRIGLITFFVMAFTFFYSIGAGPVPFTLSAEIFPLANRDTAAAVRYLELTRTLVEAGMSFAVFWNFLGLGLLIIFIPRLTYAFGHGSGRSSADGQTNFLALFAGLNALCFILVYLLVPSTAKPKLEEMNYIFGVPTREHIKYQLFEMLPWLFNRYVRRRYDLPKPPFYMWSSETQPQP